MPATEFLPSTSTITTRRFPLLVQAQVAREVWTFRISYIDPTNPSAAEVNIGFVGGFGGGNNGDYTLEWVRRIAGGHSCFTFYPCDYYGLNLDYLTGTAAWSLPSCTMKLGPGYHATVRRRHWTTSPHSTRTPERPTPTGPGPRRCMRARSPRQWSTRRARQTSRAVRSQGRR